MNKYLAWVLARLEEPSTWAGGGLIAIALKASGLFSDELIIHILAAGAGFGGLLAVILPEKSPVEKVTPTKVTKK